MPTYHFTSPTGVDCVPFDPNGAIFWNGRYHLGYIYGDLRDQVNGCWWGHASSVDLIHWVEHPPMVFPQSTDFEDGIFSGNAFVDRLGRVVLMYYGFPMDFRSQLGGICIAVNDDDNLIHFNKLDVNPVMQNPGWDPYGWLGDQAYYAISGGMATKSAATPADEMPQTRSQAALYRCTDDDLTKWTLVGDLLSADMPDVGSDEDISCPDLFTLGDKQVLLCISHTRGARYYIGRFEEEQFHPEQHFRMNWPGGSCFAPETLLDDHGRRIFWAWAVGSPSSMTLPRVLSLGDDGLMRIEPAEEIEALRLNHRRLENIRIAPGAAIALGTISGDCLEIRVVIRPQGATSFGVKVRCSGGGEEETEIACDPKAKALRVNFARSSLDEAALPSTNFVGTDDPVTAQEAPFTLEAGESLDLRIFVDRSMLEVFANGRQCLTQRIYPTLDESVGVKLFAVGGEAVVLSVDAWDMGAVTLE
jgi:sucrose-6-phosphate hydrolase SacC (GH32 family)